MARNGREGRGDTGASGPRTAGGRLALAAAVVALVLSPLVAYVAASFGGGGGPGTPAVWSVPGVALVVLYALGVPAGAFTAWGTAGSGRLPVAGALVAVAANLAALGVLLGARAGEFTWGAGLVLFVVVFLLPGALAAAAAVLLRRTQP